MIETPKASAISRYIIRLGFGIAILQVAVVVDNKHNLIYDYHIDMIHVYHIKDIAPLGNLRSDFVDVSRQSSGVTWQHKGQTLKIEAWGRGILRIRATGNRQFYTHVRCAGQV